MSAADIELLPRLAMLSAPEDWLSSTGSNSQPSRYSGTPAPPEKVATTNATRTSTGSMAYRRLIAAATPATLRSFARRRGLVAQKSRTVCSMSISLTVHQPDLSGS